MNISALIGKKVIHKTLGEGRIIEISNGYITVEFSNKTSKFVFENFDQFFAFEDVETCDIITSVIESIKKEKAEAEAANKAAEEQKKQAMAAASITTSASSPKKRMPLADNTTPTLHDSDCATFSYCDKIRVTIKESDSSKKLIRDMYQACDESDPIIVFEGDTYLGKWEVEEWYEDVDQNGARKHFFQLIPFLHISLIQHPNKMYTSWPVISKHIVSYQIEDKNIRLDYEENRMSCGSVNTVIPVNIYKNLKSLFRSSYNCLNTNSGSGYSEENAVMGRFPFGGVSVTPYSYHIGDKQATYVSPLFIGDSNASSSFNELINDIETACKKI